MDVIVADGAGTMAAAGCDSHSEDDRQVRRGPYTVQTVYKH